MAAPAPRLEVSRPVTQMAHQVGVRLRCDEIQLGLLHLGGALHDVGKLVVSEAILAKPGPLDEEEIAEVRRHPEAGARMVALDRSLRPAFPGVLFHHERWDGGGYPTGCAGVQIPLEARILSVVDSYDAMTSDRPYRAALPARARAFAEVDRCAGEQFDPDVAWRSSQAWESGAFGVTAAPPRRSRLLKCPPLAGLERRPDLELRLHAPDHLVGELGRRRVAAEVGGAHAVGDRLEARLANRARGRRRACSPT